MQHEVKLPEVGENVSGGVVTKILINVGDVIRKDQPIVEMETDKAVVEVPSPNEGRVDRILIKVGEKVSVGQTILVLETELTPTDAATDAATAPSAPMPPPSVESASFEQLASASEAESRPAVSSSVSSMIAETGTRKATPAPVAAAPSVRRFARELGIDIHKVPGSGPGGRISIEDVKAYVARLNRTRTQTVSPPPSPIGLLPDFEKWGPVERQALSPVREAIAKHMSLAWSQIPHVTHFDSADITDIEERRKKLAAKLEKTGAKLTITAILIKIAASALKNFPKFNASLDITRSEVILKKYYHIGVAVDTPRGLLVPVIRHADQKNIVQIATELAELAEKARSGKLSLEEMQGGTFTITNLGGIGGTYFTPIINYPEVAILGVGRAKHEPSFNEKNGCCSPRLILPLALSYDHRLIDGAEAARFLRWIAEALEEPLLIPLEG